MTFSKSILKSMNVSSLFRLSPLVLIYKFSIFDLFIKNSQVYLVNDLIIHAKIVLH